MDNAVSQPLTLRQRIASVDVVRGVIMVVMALDHVRDFTSNTRVRPEDLAKSWPALFATRWITHFCAPGFMLLAGLGIGLALGRRKDPGGMSRFLFLRGLWLVLLDLTVSTFGWEFGLDFHPAIAIVLWALGWSMVVMAALIRLPRAVVAAISIALIAGHNLLDSINPASLGAWEGVWHFLHVPGFVILGKLLVTYPLIPWVGVMGLGFSLAAIYQWDGSRRRRFLLSSGIAVTAGFVLLRALNSYGDPAKWAHQRSAALTVASFLNLQKYPPSLLYLLMTLGPILIALSLTENARGRIASWFNVYGSVPMFYYVGHIFLAHLVAVALGVIQGGELLKLNVITGAEAIPSWYGVGLPGVYLSWAIVVALMYYPCRLWSGLKATRNDWWLRYT